MCKVMKIQKLTELSRCNNAISDKFLKIELRINVPNFINESIIHNKLPLSSSSIIMREFGAAVCMI